ncbi:MAG: DNA polymerase III subunit alpha [Candidatus Bipolaricaulia bacterium]
MIDFVHLHTHCEYSILDATARIDALLDKAEACRMPALALTDHGVMSGAVELYRKARDRGINPVIGCELYVAPTARTERSAYQKYNHLVVLVETDEGYCNLVKLVSKGFIEGFYYKPRVDYELLRKYHKGLIALSACHSGVVSRRVIEGKTDKAIAAAQELEGIFGRGNFFLELQDHGLDLWKTTNDRLREIAETLDIPLVVTNDVHYVEPEDAEAHEVFLNIQGGKTIDDPNHRIYEGDGYYFRSPDEMAVLFPDDHEALANTVRIAERCQVNLDFETTHLPKYKLPDGYSDANRYLEELAFAGAQARYGSIPAKVEDRLRYELSVIEKEGFAASFLIVQDFVQFAKRKRIPVGPGRGSSAGSLVSYCLGITGIDPLKYNLLFERFLNPDRISPPDFDIDFCMRRRDEMIDYVEKRYGRDRVAQIITFDTIAARGSVRDVARVLGIPYGEADEIAKQIPFGISLQEALRNVKALKQRYESDERVRQLFDISMKLEGLVRNASTHAAGVVIAPGKITDFVPLQRLTTKELVTEYDMVDLEVIGMLKMDFLGLRTLTVIADALQAIEDATGELIDIEAIPLDDVQTYALLQQGKTVGVFQLESSGMRDLVRRLRPTGLNDMIALVGLYRPGPLESGMADAYVERKHGYQRTTYPHPELREILEDTYGLPIYQEQLMQMAVVLAGFSLSEADTLRKAIGKKNRAIMDEMRSKFIDGCVANGIDRSQAESLFADIDKFARYGFNRAHSTAYGLISYWTAYLKANYSTYYMASLLTSVGGNKEKLAEYIQTCRDMGIRVLPPDVNESEVNFTSVGDREIRFGLGAIKHVGEGAVVSILKARGDVPFNSFLDVCRRVDPKAINKEVLESLIKAGAFDSLESNRRCLLNRVDEGMEIGQRSRQERLSGQRSFFSDEEETPDSPPDKKPVDFSEAERLKFEKELLGLYISGHPLLAHEAERLLYTSCSLGEVSAMAEGQELLLAGKVERINRIVTRNAEPMAFVTLEDLTAELELTVFPEPYSRYVELLSEEALIWVRGQTSLRNGEIQVIAEEILPLARAGDRVQVTLGLVLEVGSIEPSLLDRLQRLLRAHPGKIPVYIQVDGSGSQGYVTVRAGPDYSVELTGEMLDALKELPGVARVGIQRGLV